MADERTNNPVRIPLIGRIDSNNALQKEQEITAILSDKQNCPVILDARDLVYISSAGLRILLRIKKSHPDLRLSDVSNDVYDILEMTGFTEIITIEKSYRSISIEGCELIGEGANGKVYRINNEMVVKTYKNNDALSEIQHEREVARTALVLGIPTAISYEVVKVGDGYGSVFELLNATSFAKILANTPERIDWCVKEYVNLLKLLHRTVAPEGKLPSVLKEVRYWVDGTKLLLPPEYGKKLERLIADLPDRNTVIHGDCHTKNIELAGNEVLLIDMDTLAVGHPIFEFAQIYNSYIGFSERDPSVVERFQGYSASVANEVWRRTLKGYFETDDEALINKIEEMIRVVSYTRLVDWGRRHFRPMTAEKEATLNMWKNELVELLDKLDSIDFLALSEGGDSNELEIDADIMNLDQVQSFVEEHLAQIECSPKSQMQIGLAVEEVFVNIAHYAYAPDIGTATVRVEVTQDPVCVTITFIDHGVPYDPLKKEDPDVTLSADQRQIGGLGIFLTKKTMDNVSYEYKNGQNILTLKKNL